LNSGISIDECRLSLTKKASNPKIKPDLQLPMKSGPITTKVVSLNPAHGMVHSIQHYVIDKVSCTGNYLTG
jgi:hypothetical protein